jgi:hypothetical protein
MTSPGTRAACPTWCALFVAARSPGAVFGWIERRRQDARVRPLAAFDLVLSDSTVPPPGGESWRVLALGGDDGASATADAGTVWLEAVAPELAAAFPPGVTLLWADEARHTWGWRTFPSGGDTDRIGDQGQQQPVPPRTLLARLAGQPSPTATVCARDWALARGLPADRIPAVAARTGAAAPPEIPYETVAGLDARGLLHESGPRLYRLCLTADTR